MHHLGPAIRDTSVQEARTTQCQQTWLVVLVISVRQVATIKQDVPVDGTSHIGDNQRVIFALPDRTVKHLVSTTRKYEVCISSTNHSTREDKKLKRALPTYK